MLGKKRKKINPNTTDTLIGEGSTFEGKIKSEASLRIEGRLSGDIECLGDVTVGENGHVNSNINARNVTIAGSVHGNVTTNGGLTITATGRLYGNVITHSLIIAEGGIFEGQSRMPAESDKAAAEKEPAPSGVSSGSSAASPGSQGYSQTYGKSGNM